MHSAKSKERADASGVAKSRRDEVLLSNVEATQETVERKHTVPEADLTRARELAAELVAELADMNNGDLVGDVIDNALKLLRDRTNRGDIKLIDKSFKELRYALRVFSPYRDTRKVSIFGSARTPEGHPDYETAAAFGRAMAEAGWMIITGAGGGIMEAGHVGADVESSFGLNISLPFEQSANEVIHGDTKLVDFKYFFTRKLMFMRTSHAIVLCPGGFGTMDEGFEALTLVQTGKSVPVPIVLLEKPGGAYWKAWDEYVRGHLLAGGLISPEDTSLYRIAETVEDAVDECRRFYRNYHSLRYTRNSLLLRLQQKPTEAQLDEIREKFADIAVKDDWRTSGPLRIERNEPDLRHLTRLAFTFNRKDHGRLRQLIDYLNGLV
ncbi:MAG: TIGR00730 family Rossman fold protein [Planctomycetota bacterium]